MDHLLATWVVRHSYSIQMVDRLLKTSQSRLLGMVRDIPLLGQLPLRGLMVRRQAKQSAFSMRRTKAAGESHQRMLMRRVPHPGVGSEHTPPARATAPGRDGAGLPL